MVPGDFMVFVQCEGYVNGQLTNGPGMVLRLKPGDSRTGLTVEIEKEGSISGRVTDAETGMPIRGLAVVPMRWHSGGGARALVFVPGRATTDAQGRYELKGLRPGEYILKVQPPIFDKFLPGGTPEEFRERVPRTYGRGYYPGVERREQATPVTLLAGSRLDRTDMKFARRLVASIRGTVLAGSRTAEGKEIQLGLSEAEVQGTTHSFSSVAHGKWLVGQPFRLDNLSPGHYVLVASVPTTDGSDPDGAILQFDMDDRSQDHLDLTLTPGVTVSGAVKLHESLTGLLPVEPQPRLLLRPLGRSLYSWDLAPALIEAGGNFTRTGLMPGSYSLQLHPLPKGMAIGEVRYNGSPVERGVVTFNAGALDHRLEVILWPATASIAITARRGMKPAADAQLVAVREPFDPADPQADALAVQADAEGHGTFFNLLAGKYRLLAFTPGADWRTGGQLAQRLPGAAVADLDIGAAVAVELKVAEP